MRPSTGPVTSRIMLLSNAAVSAQVPPSRVSTTKTVSGPSPTHFRRSPDAAPHPASALFSQLALAGQPSPPINAVSYLSMHTSVLSNGVDVCVVVGVVDVVGVVLVVGVVVVGEVVGVDVAVVVVVGVDVAVVVVSTASTALVSTPSITTTSVPLDTCVAKASAPSVDAIVTAAWIPATPRRERCRCLPLATQATRNPKIES